MKIGRWSTTAGNNNATPPDGFPEGQAPSTVNDGMREVMASLRVAFNDLQYVDQALTPTQINATSFSVPGNQTSAIHAGRRLKLSDANVVYGTVSTASFTTVTTINVDVDGGATLTSSLSSFGIAVLSNQNDSLPRGVNASLSAVACATLSVSATATFRSVANFAGISCSSTAVAPNITKAWGEFANVTGSAPQIQAVFNISSISRSAVGVYRINFINAFADSNYSFHITVHGFKGATPTPPTVVVYDTINASSIKFQTWKSDGTTADWVNARMAASFWHT